MVKYLTFFLCITLFSAESQSIFFEKKFGGNGAENAEVVKEIAGGDIFIGGYSDSLNQNGVFDAVLSRLDRYGNLKWIKHYASPENDFGLYMAQLRDGSFFMVGEVNTGNQNGIDVLLLKLDTAGNLIWKKSFGGPGDQSLQFADTTENGNVIACGYASSPNGDNDVLLVHLDTSGNIIWQKLHGGSQADYGDGIHQTKDGGFILSAVTSSFGSGSTDGWLLRLNSVGDTIWTRTSGNQFAGGCQGTLLLKNGDFLLYGEEEVFSGSGFNFWVHRFDSIGISKWKKNFGGNGSDALFTICEDNQGSLYAAGYSNSFNFGAPLDLIVMKLDSSGNQLWRKTYGGPGVDICYDMIPSSSGGLILTGIFTDPFLQSQFYLLHLDTLGTLMQSYEFNYDDNSIRVFPNPTHEILNLERRKCEKDLQVTMVNNLGEILFSIKIQAGEFTTKLPIQSLSGGIYFLQLSDFEKQHIKKVVITR